VLIGITISFVGTLSLRSLLFDLGPWDPVTFIAALVFLGLAGLVASYIPAGRAGKSDPLVAIRVD